MCSCMGPPLHVMLLLFFFFFLLLLLLPNLSSGLLTGVVCTCGAVKVIVVDGELWSVVRVV